MPSTYDQKRAELAAVAEGGSAGREAYKQGRERMVSDQRSAIDAALAGPVRFGEGTAAALDSIVAPVGETGLARLDTAGDRHGASMAGLDSALSSALTQQGGARGLNYSETLRRGRQSTDRNIEMGEISRRKAAEDLWRRNAEAAAERAARAGGGDYSQGEEKMAAEALGAMVNEERLDKFAPLDLLGKMLGWGGKMGTLGAEAKRMQEAGQDTSQNILDVLTRTGAAGGPSGPGRDRAGRPSGIADVAIPSPASRETGIDPAELLAWNQAQGGQRDQNRRRVETERYLDNQAAYTHLFGDPLLAQGIFPQSFGATEDTLDATRDAANYAQTGLYGSAYDDWVKEQESLGEFDDTRLKFDIATGAATNPAIVDNAAKSFGIVDVDLYSNLEPGTAGHEVVTNVLTDSVAALEAGEMLPEEAIAEAFRATRADALDKDLDATYAAALAEIVVEQLKVYLGPGA